MKSDHLLRDAAATWQKHTQTDGDKSREVRVCVGLKTAQLNPSRLFIQIFVSFPSVWSWWLRMLAFSCAISNVSLREVTFFQLPAL